MYQTFAVLALFADGPTRIRNIYNWRVKETDRLSAMATELRKLGAEIDEQHDAITVNPPAKLQPATIDFIKYSSFSQESTSGGIPLHRASIDFIWYSPSSRKHRLHEVFLFIL